MLTTNVDPGAVAACGVEDESTDVKNTKDAAVEIDGGLLEGGGQIMRLSLPLSCLFDMPVNLVNIRKGRARPGLSTQHLTVAKVMTDISGGTLLGGVLQSTELRFQPGNGLSNDNNNVDTRTAASITLIMQALLPYLATRDPLLGALTFKIIGGTHVSFSPPLDHFRFVLLPLLGHMGIHVEILSFKYGYYPIGRGYVKFRVVPGGLAVRTINITAQLPIKRVFVSVWGTGLDCMSELAESVCDHVRAMLPVVIAPYISNSVPVVLIDYELTSGNSIEHNNASKGKGKKKYSMLGCQIWCESENEFYNRPNANFCIESGGSNGTNEEINPLSLARGVTDRLRCVISSGAAVDEHTADQLLVYMALAAISYSVGDGISRLLVEPHSEQHSSLHIETAIATTQHLMDTALNQGKLARTCRFQVNTDPITMCRTIECHPVA